MIVYTVIANRFGDDHKHSYLVGVYSNKENAARAAISEEYWRGGKYSCNILENTMDHVDAEREEYCLAHCLGNEAYKDEIESITNSVITSI